MLLSSMYRNFRIRVHGFLPSHRSNTSSVQHFEAARPTNGRQLRPAAWHQGRPLREGVVPPPRTTPRRAKEDREPLVRPVAAAAQAQGAAARKGLGAGRRAGPGDHRDRAPRRGQVVGRSPPGRAGRARRHSPLLAGLGHHAAASARRWHRSRERFRLRQCVRLLRAGRGPPGPSQKEEDGPVRRHRNDGDGGPGSVRARLAPGREITGAVRPAVRRVCWRRTRRKKTAGGPGQPPARRTPTGSSCWPRTTPC